jgi:hypothetical protein
MTTLAEAVWAQISGAGTSAGSRVFPNVIPDNTSLPFVRFHRLHSAQENIVLGGFPSIENTHLQVDSFAIDYAAAIALAKAIETTMYQGTFRAILLREEDHYEPDVKLHHVVQEYSIWNA